MKQTRFYRTGNPVKGGNFYVKNPKPDHERTGTRNPEPYLCLNSMVLAATVIRGRFVNENELPMWAANAARAIDNNLHAY